MNKVNYDKDGVLFENLIPGDIFTYNDKVYMKIENSFRHLCKGCNYPFEYITCGKHTTVYDIAVNLENGKVDSFDGNTMVQIKPLDRVEIEKE